MPSSHHSASRLIIAGLVVLILAGGNILFGFTDALADAIQYRQVQADETKYSANLATDIPPLVQEKGISVVQPTQASPTESLAAQLPVTPTIVKEGFVPDRIVIPSIQLDAPIISSEVKSVELRDQWFDQWQVPDEFAAGWIDSSAPLGLPGNTVLSGHHNEYGKVFGHLVDLQVGDKITVYSGNRSFEYVITDRMILKEKDVSLAIRQENARWISPTPDERITLVTCWPKRNNTHRLIIVARPAADAGDFLLPKPN
jgi:LPXTG-site transpeptidase (sortase) family protein